MRSHFAGATGRRAEKNKGTRQNSEYVVAADSFSKMFVSTLATSSCFLRFFGFHCKAAGCRRTGWGQLLAAMVLCICVWQMMATIEETAARILRSCLVKPIENPISITNQSLVWATTNSSPPLINYFNQSARQLLYCRLPVLQIMIQHTGTVLVHGLVTSIFASCL